MREENERLKAKISEDERTLGDLADQLSKAKLQVSILPLAEKAFNRPHHFADRFPYGGAGFGRVSCRLGDLGSSLVARGRQRSRVPFVSEGIQPLEKKGG